MIYIGGVIICVGLMWLTNTSARRNFGGGL